MFLGRVPVLLSVIHGLALNGPRSVGIISQHRGLEFSKLSDPKSKDLGLGALRNGRYWSSCFLSKVDLLGLGKF